MDIRLEEYGKMMISQLPKISEEVAIQKLKDVFVKSMGSRYYLLLSKEVDYYTVFSVSGKKSADNFYQYLLDSFFKNKNGNLISMADIRYIEERDDGATEIWIGDTYFHLTPFDWGVVGI